MRQIFNLYFQFVADVCVTESSNGHSSSEVPE